MTPSLYGPNSSNDGLENLINADYYPAEEAFVALWRLGIRPPALDLVDNVLPHIEHTDRGIPSVRSGVQARARLVTAGIICEDGMYDLDRLSETGSTHVGSLEALAAYEAFNRLAARVTERRRAA